MKNLVIRISILIISLSLFQNARSQGVFCTTVGSACDETDFTYCGPYKLSAGIYRIPFMDGAIVEIGNDHIHHCPRGRIDMNGTVEGFHIAAAADGWIRAIVDDHTEKCDCDNGESCSNNYVWIEHPNGEWTKYTHMQTGSVSDAGRFEDEWVTAGTDLGIEGDVGCASGLHLHFEVAVPVDTNTLIFSEDGGYIDSDWAENLIPVICDISGNIFEDGESYFAIDCSGSCTSTFTNTSDNLGVLGLDVDIAATSITAESDVSFSAYSAGLYQAGTEVILKPGFEALVNSTFTARVAGCNQTPLRMNEDTTPGSTSENPDQRFTIYPNPSTGEIIVTFSVALPQSSLLKVYDLTGRVLTEKTMDKNTQSIELDLSWYPNGTYFIESASEFSSAEKVIIVR